MSDFLIEIPLAKDLILLKKVTYNTLDFYRESSDVIELLNESCVFYMSYKSLV